jgi:molybdopterin synthase catalytic subunit
LGLVRGVAPDGRRLAALELEHYPGMTESSLAAIIDQAMARFDVVGCTVIHRIGRLPPGARIVFVAVASAHRQPALDATGFLIDWLKTAAPFWKQEFYDDDTHAWVPAKTTDDEAAAKWIL